jgi:hypothetical protein
VKKRGGNRTGGTPKKKAGARKRAATAPARALKLVPEDCTATDKARALKAFVRLGTVSAAVRVARVARSTWYDWVENDETFARQVLSAHDDVADDLEAEAIKRAKAGSDTLIIFLLKSKRPMQFRDRLQIETVSPDVQSRLARQADAILELCPPEIAAPLANRLREIWA